LSGESGEAQKHGGARVSKALDRAEIDALLQRNCWGVLALSVNDEPYGVPVIYGYDGETLVFANGPGQKLAMLEQNPRVTFTVVEVEEYGRRWRSVIVKGRVEWIEDLTAKLSAFNTLRKQIPFSAQRMRDASKLASARVARLVPSEITGRAAGA